VDKPLNSATHGCAAPETYGYLPSCSSLLPCDWYQIILLCEWGTWVNSRITGCQTSRKPTPKLLHHQATQRAILISLY